MARRNGQAFHDKVGAVADVFDGCTTWPEIRRRIAAQPTTTRMGDAFEVLVAALAAIDPALQIADHDNADGGKKVWFPAKRAPRYIKERLGWGNTPNSDMGCDGLALDRNGCILAFQPKFHTDQETLGWNKDKLANFRAVAAKADASYVYTTAKAADRMAGLPGVHYVLDGDLERLFADKPERLADVLALIRDGAAPSPKQRHETRADQDAAIAEVMSAFQSADRALVVSACGTGKTLTAERVMEAMVEGGARDIVVFVPSIALISQITDDWQDEWNGQGKDGQPGPLAGRVDFLAVCSDETATDRDDTMAFKAADLAIPSTTDAAEVARILTAPRAADRVRVVFSTYQSSSVIEDAAKAIPGFAFDLGVCDEAHKTAVNGVSPMFTRPLHDENIPIRKRLFTTATPRARRRRKQDDEAKPTYSMDNVSIYGEKVWDYGYDKASKDGVVVPFKVVVNLVSPEDLGLVDGKDFSKATVEFDGQTMDAQTAAARLSLARSIKMSGAKRVIAFHDGVTGAKRMVADPHGSIGAFLAAEGLDGWQADHIRGTHPMAQRKAALSDFRHNGRRLLSNARCLLEGVDVPSVDMVAFMSPKDSKFDIVQAIGRALRRADGKEFGYVTMPLLVGAFGQDFDSDLERSASSNGYETLYAVLSALADQDPNFVAVLNDLNEAYDSGDEAAIEEAEAAFGGRVEFTGSQSAGRKPKRGEAARNPDDARRLDFAAMTRAVTTKLLADKLVSPTELKVRQLLAEPSGVNVHTGKHDLGDWVDSVRQGKVSLTGDQWQRLNDAGLWWGKETRIHPDWRDKPEADIDSRFVGKTTEDVNREAVDVNIARLLAEPGGVNVTKRKHDLGDWVCSVRQGKVALTGDQWIRLNEAGFLWGKETRIHPDHRNKPEADVDPRFVGKTTEDVNREAVDVNIARLLAEPGGVNVTQRKHDLGQWVDSVRQGKVALTGEQWLRLNEAGFWWGKETRIHPDWRDKPEADIDSRFVGKTTEDVNREAVDVNIARLLAEPGGVNVTQGKHDLGDWVCSVRQGKVALTGDQWIRLNEAGFLWRKKTRVHPDHRDKPEADIDPRFVGRTFEDIKVEKAATKKAAVSPATKSLASPIRGAVGEQSASTWQPRAITPQAPAKVAAPAQQQASRRRPIPTPKPLAPSVPTADRLTIEIGGSVVFLERGIPVKAILPDGTDVEFPYGTAIFDAKYNVVRWNAVGGKCLMLINKDDVKHFQAVPQLEMAMEDGPAPGMR